MPKTKIHYSLFIIHNSSKSKGFTLIELLVTLSIIAVLVGLSFFGIQGARESARDARRKADLEMIRSGLELYKSDCLGYPMVFPPAGGALTGGGTPSSCTGTYIASRPGDPLDPNRSYLYSGTATAYEICASLEKESQGTQTCGGSSNCGSGASCNYKLTNP